MFCLHGTATLTFLRASDQPSCGAPLSHQAPRAGAMVGWTGGQEEVGQVELQPRQSFSPASSSRCLRILCTSTRMVKP